MPNPYHDGTGRFCSKGEMRAAIDTALKDQKFDAYYQLRQDYEAASKESLTVTPIQKPADYVPPVVVAEQGGSFTEKLILAGNGGRLNESPESGRRAQKVSELFAKRNLNLSETQVSLLSDSMYHINRAGYHDGASREMGDWDKPKEFDNTEAANHIITRLGIFGHVYDESRDELAEVTDEAWESGVGSGRWDV